MLDPARELPVSAACGARVFHDAEDPGTVYAVPRRPRLAVDDRGRPAIRLVAVARRQPPVSVWLNGSLTLTTRFELTDEERARVETELASLLPPADVVRQAPAFGALHWTRGQVRVQLLEAPWAVLEGTPSLAGRNECALARTFAAQELAAVMDAWRDGLPAAHITYDLVTPAAAATRASAAAEASGDEPGRRWHSAMSAELTARHVADWAVHAQAGLDLLPGQLAASLDIVDL